MRGTLCCLLFLVFVAGSFCSSFYKKQFEIRYSDGGKLFQEGKFTQAEAKYRSALEIAEGQQWTGQRAAVRQRLAEIYFATDRFEQAKDELLTARDICVSNRDCPPGILGSVYDYLILFSLTRERNVSEAMKYIDEVIDRRSLLESDEPLDSRLKRYAQELRSSGFPSQAAEVEKKSKS